MGAIIDTLPIVQNRFTQIFWLRLINKIYILIYQDKNLKNTII